MTDDPLIGRKLSNFQIKRVLGRGGMAQVYYGLDVKLQRPVAIKVIDARYRDQPAYAKRFVREARSVATWHHENIIQIYHADDQDGLYYYVMEYIDGQDLAGLMASASVKGKFMPPEDLLRIGRAIASALDYAHEKGLIHRDVKPSNILLTKSGRVVLSDFGLALDLQQGSSGEAFGTPHYISPEQARRSTDAVPQSDLYSFGVILYEMLTGVVPFDDESPTNVALQHMTQPPPPPRSLNPQLNLETEAVLLKALSKKPDKRYQTGQALMAALEKALKQATPSSAQRALPLPPMPAAIVAGKTRPLTRRKAAARVEKTAPKPRWPRQLMFFLILLSAVVIFGIVLFPGRFAALAFPFTPTPASAPTASAPPAVPLPVVALPTQTSPATLTLTRTSAPTASPRATTTSTITATPTLTSVLTSLSATLAVTATVTDGSTETSTSSPTAPALPIPASLGTPTLGVTPSATTTQVYANYKRLWLYYDAYGLYLYNASDANRSISPLSFERLAQNGTASNLYEGWRWAEFYPTLHPERCMRIEIQGNPNPYLNPALCKNYYLSTRSLTQASDLLFWTTSPTSTQFRVLWNKVPVGLCEIQAGFCEVFVP